MEESGQMGVDHLIQLDPLQSLTPSSSTNAIRRLDLIHALAPQGTWVCGEALQLDPPESTILLRKGASLAFCFQPVWLLAPTQQGRFLHVLDTIMDLASRGILKTRAITTYPLERARLALRDLDSKPGKLVLRM